MKKVIILEAIAMFVILLICLSSCSAGLVIGRSNRQYQETKTSVNADSTQFQPSITIR